MKSQIYKTSTLIDNVLSNPTFLEENESGNVTSTFSDNLQQFIFLPDFFSRIRVRKSDILRRDWKKFESTKFISDFNQTNWKQILYNEENDVNFSMNEYLSKIDSLLEITMQHLKNSRKRN